MKYLVLSAALLSISACSATQLSQAVADGQLFCALTTNGGSPLTVAVQNALNNTPILAKNNSAFYVQSICGLLGAVPVSPPAAPQTAPSVAVAVPASLTRG